MDSTSANPTRTSTPSLFFRPGTMETLVCAITALAYLGTLSFGFVYDDAPQILRNPAIQHWQYVPQYFTSHVWAAIYPNSTGNYYRPVFLLWLRLNYALFGATPAGWHATSILCHVVATYLVFRLVEQLTPERFVAFAAALLFGLHPAHIENVAWISGVTDPLMACFVLGSCFAFLRFRVSRKALALALSLGLFALALLSKETAIVLPLLIFALSLVNLPAASDVSGIPQRTNAALKAIAPFILLSLIYLVVRYHALRGLAHSTISISWTEVFLTWPSVLWFYARHLILPLHLSEFYSLNYVDHANVPLVLWPVLLLFVVGLVFYFLIRLFPRKDVAYFALALIVLPLLPVLDLRSLTVGDIVHDRYLYLPSAGFVLLLALSIPALQNLFHGRLRLILPPALLCTISLAFAAGTLLEQTQWSSDILLYSRGTESAPDNLTVRDNLANALLGANQPDRAISLYLDVLKRNPDFWRSNYNLGFVHYKVGNFPAADQFLRHAILIDGTDSDQYIYLALVEFGLNRLPEAEANARQAIARNPQARGYHYILGLIAESEHARPAAIAAFHAELSEHPDNAPAMAELQKLEGTAALP
jgi:protein O-mannosyl-transferase